MVTVWCFIKITFWQINNTELCLLYTMLNIKYQSLRLQPGIISQEPHPYEPKHVIIIYQLFNLLCISQSYGLYTYLQESNNLKVSLHRQCMFTWCCLQWNGCVHFVQCFYLIRYIVVVHWTYCTLPSSQQQYYYTLNQATHSVIGSYCLSFEV